MSEPILVFDDGLAVSVWDWGSKLSLSIDGAESALSSPEVHRLSVALSLWLAKQKTTT